MLNLKHQLADLSLAFCAPYGAVELAACLACFAEQKLLVEHTSEALQGQLLNLLSAHIGWYVYPQRTVHVDGDFDDLCGSNV